MFMTQRNCRLLVVVAYIALTFAGCTSTKLPPTLLGNWVENQSKQGLSGEAPQWEKTTTPSKLRFEQQGRHAVVFVSFYVPMQQTDSWSEPYPVKEVSNNSWSFKYHGREVSLALDDKNELQVKGLMMRSYNQNLIKKGPEPVEAIFIKKG